MDIYNTSPNSCAHLHVVPSQGVPSIAAGTFARSALTVEEASPTEAELEDALAASEIGICDDEVDTYREALAVSDRDVDVEADALLRAQVAMLRAHLDRLSRSEYAVITLRFGLVGDAWTVDQVAFGLRRSPASIRRIERRAMAKLRVLFGVEEGEDA